MSEVEIPDEVCLTFRENGAVTLGEGVPSPMFGDGAWAAAHYQLRGELPGWRARAERAEALLRKLEWAGGEQAGLGDGTQACCPCCHVWLSFVTSRGGPDPEKNMHRADCELAAIIGAKVAT